ncbi:MAG: D-alanine--D-alanine ligase [Patescibacteria group bacterium]
MLKTRVAVLRGGPSSEYEISLQTGKTVLDNLPEEHYTPYDIFIDRSGIWHRSGLPKEPIEALKDMDVVFNALHGTYGEDGKLQTILDQIAMPYTGSGALSSALGMNKVLAKKHFLQNGIKTPHYKLLSIENALPENLVEIFRTFPHPAVVKPYNSGSSLGVSVVNNFAELQNALAKAFEYANKVLIEEYIAGREGTIGIIENFRNKEYYPLLPIEISRQNNSVFGYDTKYNEGGVSEISPAKFTKEELEKIEKAVIEAHKAIHAKHYSRVDFILSPRRGVYILEVNTLPGLTKESLMPKSLDSIGVKISDFLHHLVSLALKRSAVS